ncbi:ribonuclease III [Eubacteriales bacterium OttesenSCG-928-N13]|nr:ribonuclease III [Eubacteriales bacterium OttesenSCG-928-N13]
MQGQIDRPAMPKNGQIPGSLELAFLGDTVYDLYVRGRAVAHGGRMKQLHGASAKLVCAAAQSRALDRIEPMLTEAEQGVIQRARNAKQKPPRNADPAQYHRATALEALIGYLYLSGDIARLDQLMQCALDEHEEGDNTHGI